MWTVYHRHGGHFFVHETDQEFERTKRFYRLFQIYTESGSEFYENARGDIHAWYVGEDPDIKSDEAELKGEGNGKGTRYDQGRTDRVSEDAS